VLAHKRGKRKEKDSSRRKKELKWGKRERGRGEKKKKKGKKCTIACERPGLAQGGLSRKRDQGKEGENWGEKVRRRRVGKESLEGEEKTAPAPPLMREGDLQHAVLQKNARTSQGDLTNKGREKGIKKNASSRTENKKKEKIISKKESLQNISPKGKDYMKKAPTSGQKGP